MNTEKINGANRRPSGPTFSSSILRTKSYRYSTAACQRPGTNCGRAVPTNRKTATPTSAIAIHSELLVKERS